MSHTFTGKETKLYFTAERNDSELIVYQTKNTAKEMQQQDQQKTNLKQVQSTIIIRITVSVWTGLGLFYKALYRTVMETGPYFQLTVSHSERNTSSFTHEPMLHQIFSQI